jgi:hypothetical protein
MGWRVAFKSVPGRRHKLNGVDCQDAAVIRFIRSDLVIAAIADGAGSVEFAKEGAWLSVQGSVDYLASRLEHKSNIFPTNVFESRKLFEDAVASVREKIAQVAQEKQKDLSCFASTLIVMVASSQGLMAFQVGDGFMVFKGIQGYELALEGDKGEYLNETNFVTDPKVRYKVWISETVCPFWALSTDGLDQVAIHHKSRIPFPGFFDPFAEYLGQKPSEADIERELEAFLTSSQLQARAEDDMTLLIGGWE